jgi:hypothetical protein
MSYQAVRGACRTKATVKTWSFDADGLKLRLELHGAGRWNRSGAPTIRGDVEDAVELRYSEVPFKVPGERYFGLWGNHSVADL